jgi:hypothetical protein
MLIQVRTQTSYITYVEEVGAAKCCIFIRCWWGKPIDRDRWFQCTVSASPSSEIHIRGQL